MNIARMILNTAIPITRFIGRMHAPFSHKLIKAIDYREACEVLTPGSILLSNSRGEFSNLFIPGFWSHAAIYTGNKTVVEAVGRGVVSTDLLDFMFSKDYVCVLTPTFATSEQMESASKWATDQIGCRYEYSISSSGLDDALPLSSDKKERAFYCSKLGYLAYKDACGTSPFTLRETYGLETVTPQDFYNANTKWIVKWE